MKKFLIYICCISLLCCMMISPVFAAETSLDSFNGTVYSDLLYGADVTWGTARDNTPNKYNGITSSNNARIYFKWQPPVIGVSLSTIFITIYSSTPLDQVPLIYTTASGASVAGTLTGNVGNYYEYRFYPGQRIDEITLAFRYNTSTDRTVSVVNAIGFTTLYESVQAFNFYQFYNYIWSPNGIATLTRDTYKYASGASCPYESIHTEYPSQKSWQMDQYYLDIPESNRGKKTYKRVNVLIDYVGVAGSVGGSLYAAGSSVPNVILDPEDIAIQSFAENPTAGSQTSAEWTLESAIISVDLEGINLSGYTLDINFSLEPLSAGTGGDDFTYLKIRSIWFDELVTEQAWYVRMWHWISGGFDRVVDAIAGSDDPALEDGADQIQNAAQENLENEAVLESVPMPTVDAGDMLGDYIGDLSSELNQTSDPSTGLVVNTGTVLSTFTSNKYISQLILVAVTFAVMGYIFFGKKG